MKLPSRLAQERDYRTIFTPHRLATVATATGQAFEEDVGALEERA
ncbi:hypothetical protein RRSWK_06463 [Rhodopirellula sp. SWK7]|nr:hypothetical protein RRSWK_06463 [Rhodopirellula sp. SWK7]